MNEKKLDQLLANTEELLGRAHVLVDSLQAISFRCEDASLQVKMLIDEAKRIEASLRKLIAEEGHA